MYDAFKRIHSKYQYGLTFNRIATPDLRERHEGVIVTSLPHHRQISPEDVFIKPLALRGTRGRIKDRLEPVDRPQAIPALHDVASSALLEASPSPRSLT